MRIERAIDAFLDWRRLERDATPRSVDSYWRILSKLSVDYPEIRIGELTTADLRKFLNRWRDQSAATRSNVISVLHSFFGWAEAEDLIDADPSRKIRRPPKRKPDIYRPSLDELRRIRSAALTYELPAILLMEGAGLRRSEVLGAPGMTSTWSEGEFVSSGRVGIGTGCPWTQTWSELRHCREELQPEHGDHVFAVQVELWATQNERVRRWRDSKTPASEQALWRMVQRVCRRAGVRDVSPHQLRHGFANRFIRESGRDFVALQGLMWHSRPDTTQAYTDEIELDELREALERAAEVRHAQASPDLATLDEKPSSNLERLEWRRRESNPRKISIGKRSSVARVRERPCPTADASGAGSCELRSLARRVSGARRALRDRRSSKVSSD